jgi:hypothetical protein
MRLRVSIDVKGTLRQYGLKHEETVKTGIQISISTDRDFRLVEFLAGDWQMRLNQFDLAEPNS